MSEQCNDSAGVYLVDVIDGTARTVDVETKVEASRLEMCMKRERENTPNTARTVNTLAASAAECMWMKATGRPAGASMTALSISPLHARRKACVGTLVSKLRSNHKSPPSSALHGVCPRCDA
jgi:hypothetical protein